MAKIKDNTTQPVVAPNPRPPVDVDVPSGKKQARSPSPPTIDTFAPTIAAAAHGTPPETRNFFVPVDRSQNILDALKKLDRQFSDNFGHHLISHKKPWSFGRREVRPGEIGLYAHGALPHLVVRAGRYPGLKLFRHWHGVAPLASRELTFQGLTLMQVGQNEAAVVLDPQNQVFVVKNSGFVSYGAEGAFRVLDIIDQTHLGVEPHTDRSTGSLLGYERNVRDGKGGPVVATFLNIPANNVAIVQKGDHLEELPAGQHVITDPGITLRSFFTKGESQVEMKGLRVFTRDQVQVELSLFLKWQLLKPLELTKHGYTEPFLALRDKTQSILMNVMSHLDYQQMIRQRTIGAEPSDLGEEPFLDALKSRCLSELTDAATDYGIKLKDLAVLNRTFIGKVAENMERMTTKAMEIQVESANIDRSNQNKHKEQQGLLALARVAAEQRNVETEAEVKQNLARADAKAQALLIQARAEAEAIELRATAEANAILSRQKADSQVNQIHAQQMQLAREEVRRIQAYPNGTIFAPTGTDAVIGNLFDGIVRRKN